MKRFTIAAPAKINLGLDIVGTRADGYHLLETIFQTISIYDQVTVEFIDTSEIVLQCTDPNVPCDNTNIAWKAAEQFCKVANISCGIRITLEKRIPMQAGMGGGSTDGAAVLLALQKLTHEALSAEQLHQIAVTLGADVPFFLLGGTTYATGIGEELESLPPFQAKHLVIAKGQQGVSTVEAYQKIDALQSPPHPPVQQLRTALLQNKSLEEIAALCGNLFESVITSNEITKIRETMKQNGALCSVMTGSGAAVFGLFSTKTAAEQTKNTLQAWGMFAEICTTI